MRQRTEKLLHSCYRPPVVVGVQGPAGKGKTSLINALLSVDELARKSSGGVGTYVPVEYVPLGEQEAPYGFEARITLFEESQNHIRTYWKQYYMCMLSEDREFMDDTESSDLQPARDVFLALFSDIADFASEENADGFLQRAASYKDPRVLSQLLRWSKERYEKLVQVIANQPFYAHTISDLADIMEPFVQTTSSPLYADIEGLELKSAVWPFVTLGRVALNSALLEAGLILADLPGNNDCNGHRVKLAEKYSKKCQVTIVVEEIRRAEDNENLKHSIYKIWWRRRHDSVIVVLTHAVVLVDEKSCKAPLYTEEEDALETLNAHRSSLEQKIRKINVRLKDKKNRVDQGLRRDLGDEKERYETHIRHMDMLKQYLVEARNRQVKTALRKWFREKTSAEDPPPLPVFCMSTTQYMKLIRNDENRTLMTPPEFTAETTEIVALRRHLFTMVKKRGQDQTMSNYYRLVQHLVHDISLACTSFKPMYKRDHLVNIVKDAQEAIPEIWRDHRQAFTQLLRLILEEFDSSIDDWITEAGKKCDSWGKDNAVSYWTFLTRHGKHKRSSVKTEEDWNRTLLERITVDLEPLLNELPGEGCSLFEAGLKEAVDERMDNTERELRLNLDQTHAKYNEFFDTMQLLIKEIETHIQTVVHKFRDGLLRLSHECLSSEASGNPFSPRLEQIYDSVIQAHGKKSGKSGVNNSRRAMFKGSVTHKTSGPYIAIKTHIESQTNALLQAAEVQLKEACENVFTKIHHHLGQICPVMEYDRISAQERGEELREYIEKAREVLEGPAKDALLEAGIKVT